MYALVLVVEQGIDNEKNGPLSLNGKGTQIMNGANLKIVNVLND